MTVKKTGVLNRDLSALIAAMGHYDLLVIADAGFTIPKGSTCIDLSMGPNVPTVLQVLELVALELEVEKFYVSTEVLEFQANRFSKIQELFPRANCCPVAHAEFKELAALGRGFIRTGEFLPFGNVLLMSGVIY
jgi:D-ribose pyranase